MFIRAMNYGKPLEYALLHLFCTSNYTHFIKKAPDFRKGK